jgi:hypothetical protein
MEERFSTRFQIGVSTSIIVDVDCCVIREPVR